MLVFSTSINNESRAYRLNDAKCLFICYFTCQTQKLPFIAGFHQISNNFILGKNPR